MGHRKLLKEAVLWKAKSGRKLRAFLCTDILVLTDEGAKSLYRMVGLLSSTLVYGYKCTHALLSSQPIPLAEVQVREGRGMSSLSFPPSSTCVAPAFISVKIFANAAFPISDDVTIQIGLAYPRGGDKIVLRASSSREAHAWLSAIDAQSKRCRDAERKATIKAQQRTSRQY